MSKSLMHLGHTPVDGRVVRVHFPDKTSVLSLLPSDSKYAAVQFDEMISTHKFVWMPVASWARLPEEN